jgi:penicillin-binding protein 2
MRPLRPLRIKEASHETALFRWRAIVGFAIIVIFLGVLTTRFYQLQVARHDVFSAKSEANRVRLRAIPPARGLILDRNGRLLADNVPAFRLEVIPEKAGKLDSLLQDLGQVVALSEDDIHRFQALRQVKRAFQNLPLRLRLSEEEVARFAINRYRFPGVQVAPYLTRRYPQGNEFAHLVGYVGRIDSAELERLDTGAYAETTHIGKIGIERFYEDRLHGEPGYERAEYNADGRLLRSIDRQPPKPGENLYLTVDSHLQDVAEAALEGKPGAVVAVDPRNGEVLAMVSVPNFDPNPFVNGVSFAEYQALLDAPDRPLFNRALVGTYKPGSTIKPFLALAGLELGVRRPSDTVFSTGEFHIPGQQRGYRDWRKGGHGRIDMVEALAQSVNTYFYSLALDLGPDRMFDYLGQFGFGTPTGVDLTGEGRGILPSREWKNAMFGKPWYPGETVISGIGQGFWLATPVQLANAVAIMASKGEQRQLHLLKSVQSGLNEPLVDNPAVAVQPTFIHNMQNWEVIRQGMIAVVNGPTGTANKAGEGCSYIIAGKTGTAQRYSRTGETESVESQGMTDSEKHQALFIAFAPAENPRIAIALVLEFGASGAHDAAPIARRILDAWLAPPALVRAP